MRFGVVFSLQISKFYCLKFSMTSLHVINAYCIWTQFIKKRNKNVLMLSELLKNHKIGGNNVEQFR